MPAWIHDRAEHLLARNPEMSKGMAFAIATQQSRALGKSPKGYGTAEGKAEARDKFPTPKDDEKKANPGKLSSPKLAAQYTEDEKAQLRVGGAAALGGLAARPALALAQQHLAGGVVNGGLESSQLYDKVRNAHPNIPVLRDHSEIRGLAEEKFKGLPFQKYLAPHRETIESVLTQALDQPSFHPSSTGSAGRVVMPSHVGERADFLAHELGHADLDKGVGKALQNRLTMTAPNLGTLAGLGGGFAAGRAESTAGKLLGTLGPLALHVPQLAYEGLASLKGMNKLRAAGATAAELAQARNTLSKAWGTYAMNAGRTAASTGIGYGVGALTKPKKKEEGEKLGAISDQEAEHSLNRLEQLEAARPTPTQAGRYAAIGSVAGPLVRMATNKIRGKALLDFGQAPGVSALRGVAADALGGAVMGGAVPLVRNSLDQRAEVGRLKSYLAGHRAQEPGTP